MILMASISLFFASVSVYLLSKGAEARARSRTEAMYIRLNYQSDTIVTPVIPVAEKIRSVEPLFEDNSIGNISNHYAVIEHDEMTALHEVELDRNALKFLQKVEPKQERFDWNVETEEMQPTTPWFSFPEVNLFFSAQPHNGLYFVAGKIMEKYDDFLIRASDGTNHRVFEHYKFSSMEEGDIFLAQVKVEEKHWYSLRVWEVDQKQLHKEEESKVS